MESYWQQAQLVQQAQCNQLHVCPIFASISFSLDHVFNFALNLCTCASLVPVRDDQSSTCEVTRAQSAMQNKARKARWVFAFVSGGGGGGSICKNQGTRLLSG